MTRRFTQWCSVVSSPDTFVLRIEIVGEERETMWHVHTYIRRTSPSLEYSPSIETWKPIWKHRIGGKFDDRLRFGPVRLISRGNLHFRWKSTARSMPVGYSASLLKAGLFLFLAGRFVRSSPGDISRQLWRADDLSIWSRLPARDLGSNHREIRERFFTARIVSRSGFPRAIIYRPTISAKFPLKISFVLSSSRTILIICDSWLVQVQRSSSY